MSTRVCGVLAGAAMAVALVAIGTGVAAKQRDLGREVLAPGDGWASVGEGVTGGAAAGASQVYVVRTRAELIAAFNNGVPRTTSSSTPSDVPKIIYVDGMIDLNVGDANQPLTCQDYYTNGYTLEAFLEGYDPTLPVTAAVNAPLEAARVASRNVQQARVRMRPGSNTTIVGLGKNSGFRGIWLDIRGASASNRRTNIIVRNLTFEDTFDCFPAWDSRPNERNWNAEYDAISVRDADRIWIDHNEFRDRLTADSTLPTYFGSLYQVHDGLLDITNASDKVTVSWNRFVNHDKLMLIGSSDTASADRGRLNVTLHHNLFEDIGQRAPRVRFGQVHIYNNMYRIADADRHSYSWGVGVHTEQPAGVVLSGIYAENNFFRTAEDVSPADIIARFNGKAAFVTGSLWNSASDNHAVDLLFEYNAARDPDLSDNVGWAPPYAYTLDETFKVPSLIASRSGPFNW